MLRKRGRYVVAEPVFERGERIALRPRDKKGAGPGEMVLLGHGKQGYRVVRRLGRPEVARDVLEALMLDRGLRRSFPRKVADEPVTAIETPRRDLTDLPTFTIDPADAKDFDDAISADGERVWVHIADVSAYVRPGTALDAEAYRRGTSTYVPGAVEPMLPEAISNEACSLKSGVPRPAVTVEMQMSGVDVRSVSFFRSLIRSDARLDYGQVDRVFAGEETALEPWAVPLERARAVARALADRRTGALEVSSAEPVFEFDGAGQVAGVRHEPQTESHELIEHLMILANEQVATHLAERKVPALYRVHERPEPPAVAWMLERLASLEIPTPAVPKSMSPQQAGEIAAEASHLVAEHVRRSGHGSRALPVMVLRALKPAYYTPKNLGHAGLASPRYCHFTSPIRRYPDLVVHRALLASLGVDDVAPRSDSLPDAGVDASAAERAAMLVERDADDVCLAFLLERTLAEVGREQAWEGEITGVIGAGVFVEFGPQNFEGMLPVRKMRGDYFVLNQHETALVGERSGRSLRLGDPVSVVVDRVDTARGRVDLVEPE
ncbi:MAG: RNB domain-containing ribonuclease [Thermoleophilaceae bacterium]|nr:RNB domain-containing ribonuclease [Thermoleophilaceae bacterium]